MLDEVFTERWVLSLLVRYFLTHNKMSHFILWCRQYLAKAHEDEGLNFDHRRAILIVESQLAAARGFMEDGDRKQAEARTAAGQDTPEVPLQYRHPSYG